MTREEFYLKSIIAMAGNPNYVEVAPFEDDQSCITHVLRKDEILMDAERLLSEAEKEWPEAFDKKPQESVEDLLGDIRDSLNGNLSVIVEES